MTLLNSVTFLQKSVWGIVLLAGIGCGASSDVAPQASPPDSVNAPRSSNEKTEASEQSGSTVQDSAAASVSGQGSSPSRRRDEVWMDEKGGKWLGNIPYDVFFDSPSAVAADQTPLTAAVGTDAAKQNSGTQTTETPSVNPTSSAQPEPPTANAGQPVATAGKVSSWDSLISAEILDNEVKEIRNFLNENLRSVGTYNASMLSLPQKIAALGALAGIAAEHSGNLTWKADAAYIRDLARQMNAAPLQRGAKDQKRLLALFESIADTLNRSRPADLPVPSESLSYADVSEMRLLMMRMEESEKRMRTEAGNANSFSSGKTMVQHEAAVLGAMARLVVHQDYGYADDDEFVKYGRAVEDASRTINTASEAGDFSAYELTLSAVSAACQSCHSKYKND